MNSEAITISLLSRASAPLPVTQDLQLLYVLRGSCTLGWSGTHRPLEREDLFMVNSFQDCACTFASSQSLVAVLRISYVYLSEQLGNPLLHSHSFCIGKNIPQYTALHTLVQQILTHSVSQSPLDLFRRRAAHYEFLYLLADSFLLAEAAPTTDAVGRKDDRIASIYRYLHQNYNKPITLQALASQFYLSVPYLSKFLKKNMGVNFHDYLSQLRLNHAVEDMKNTSRTITQVAFQHGFPNLATFNRVFRDRYGQTPSDYRKQYLTAQQPDNGELLLRQFLSQHPFQSGDSRDRSAFTCRVDATRGQDYCKNWQDTLNLGAASDLANARVQAQLLQLKKTLDFRYGHVWGLFCRDTLINATSSIFNFTQLDVALDFLMDAGIIPFLDLGFRTKQLVLNIDSTGSNQVRTENVYEANSVRIQDPAQYKNLLTKFIKHYILRYGMDRVCKWRFELYKASHIPLSGDKSITWFQIFSIVHQCIKSYLPSVQLGVSGLITYDDNELFEEYATLLTKQELRPDFIGVNIYPYSIEQEHSLNSAASFNESYLPQKLHALQSILAKHGHSQIPLYVIEWNFSFSSRNFLHDSIYKAAYIVKNVIDCIGQTNLLSYWGSIDLLHEYYDFCHVLCGAPGLLCKDGIPKSSFYALSFLSHLKGQLLACGSHYIITTDDHNNYCIVCHNFCPPSMDYYYQYGEGISSEKVDSLFNAAPILLNFCIENARPGEYMIKKQYINQSVGNLLGEWIQFGKPSLISQDEASYLSSVSVPRQTIENTTTQGHMLTASSMLEVNEIQLIQILHRLD